MSDKDDSIHRYTDSKRRSHDDNNDFNNNNINDDHEDTNDDDNAHALMKGRRGYTISLTSTPPAFKRKGVLWFMAHMLQVSCGIFVRVCIHLLYIYTYMYMYAYERRPVAHGAHAAGELSVYATPSRMNIPKQH